MSTVVQQIRRWTIRGEMEIDDVSLLRLSASAREDAKGASPKAGSFYAQAILTVGTFSSASGLLALLEPPSARPSHS